MDMQITQIDDVTKVALAGRLDTAGTARIETRFTAVIVPPGQPAVIDLSEVQFLASLGVRMLLSTARALSGKGGRMALFGATDPVMDIIETTALNDLIPVVGSEAEALALVKA